MILDVGCGLHPKGDVNVDLLVPDDVQGYVLDPKTISNFVKADACFLPFKPNVFDQVECHHLLEHLDNPMQAVEEMVRVAKDKIVIAVPNFYFEIIGNLFRKGRKEWRGKHHKQAFTYKNVKRLLPQNTIIRLRFVDLFDAVLKKKANYRWRIPFPVPFDIIVEIQK